MKLIFTNIQMIGIGLLLSCILIFGCQEKENLCPNGDIAFNLDIDLSEVLNHESTNQTNHIKIFYED